MLHVWNMCLQTWVILWHLLANLPHVGNDQLHPGRVTSRDPDEGPIYRRVTGKEPGSSRKIGRGPRALIQGGLTTGDASGYPLVMTNNGYLYGSWPLLIVIDSSWFFHETWWFMIFHTVRLNYQRVSMVDWLILSLWWPHFFFLIHCELFRKVVCLKMMSGKALRSLRSHSLS